MPQHDHDHHHGPGHSHAKARPASAVEIECCAHEAEIERFIVLYMIGGMLVLATTISSRLGVDDMVAQLPAAIGSLLLAIPLVRGAWKEITTSRVSSSTLAALAVLAAYASGDFEAAGLLAFILLIVALFIRRTAFGAQRAIAQLVELTPETARIVEEGVEREIGIAQVRVGQVVRVRAGENLPVDGTVLGGRSTINQASLTGEAAPAEVQAGDPVYAGTTNLTGGLDVTVTQIGEQTTIGKVTQLIREAQTSKSPRQLLIEQVARFFVPVALSVAGVVWFFKSQDPATKDSAATIAATVLVVTCPVALLLASPSAMLAAFASAARLGIMVKQPHYLEAAGTVDTIVMDKTGTMTTGKFEVTKLAPAPGVDGAELLRAAANGEQHSNHPLAQSILTTARAARIELDGTNDAEEIHGRGVRARTTLGEVLVGRASWLLEMKPDLQPLIEGVEGEIEGRSGVHVMLGGRYLGAVGLEDTVRPETRGVVQRLRDLGVRQIAMFTGDRLSVAKRVGQAVGVDIIEAECHPEEKHEQIRQIVKAGQRVMMVGDGINDGPSLAAADVGVAMGLSGSDIATNSAGVALMTDDLTRIPFLVDLSRRTRAIIAQNIAASILIVLVGLVLAATGYLNAPLAALYHFAGEIFVLANSFRLFRFGEEFVHAEKEAGPAIKRRAASVRGLAPAGA